MSDPVNHPTHYTRFKSVEVIYITKWLPFSVGNTVKYILRAGYKHPSKTIEDLKKARWYLQNSLEELSSGLSAEDQAFFLHMPPREIVDELLEELNTGFEYFCLERLAKYHYRSKQDSISENLATLRLQYDAAFAILDRRITQLEGSH